MIDKSRKGAAAARALPLPDSKLDAAPDAPVTAETPPPATLPHFTPVPRRTQRHDGWTAERQRGFVATLADTGSVL